MEDATLGAYIDAVSSAIDLTIPPSCRPGVAENLRVLLSQGEGLMALRLNADEQLAPIFHP